MAEETVLYLIGVPAIMLGSILLIAGIMGLVEGDPDKINIRQGNPNAMKATANPLRC